MPKHLILCDCLGSQIIDRDTVGKATGLACSRVHTALCTREMDRAAAAITDGDAIIACAQEAARFAELAADLGRPAPDIVDIRDRAGWSEDGDTAPKMAALVAEALIPPAPVKSLDVISEGTCLILGKPDVALAAAERLADALAVTVLLDTEVEPPASRAFEVVLGRLRGATGTLGAFSVRIDALRQMQPGGRGDFAFTEARDGAVTRCDVILDLTGASPLFPAPHKRDGYIRADPGDPNAVAATVFEAAQHVGTFEKPLHLAFEETLCAHSRAGQTGCTRCLDICPTGAIRPDGDHVAIDPLVCAGCGVCSALCPSGAITYDAPPVAHLLTRIRVLAETYRAAGGAAPRLLVHDTPHGAEMISLAARYGRGLPADVIPLDVPALAGFGHAEMLAALALGFVAVDILPAPRTELDPIRSERALAAAMGGGDRLRLLDVSDPEALSDTLYGHRLERAEFDPVLPLGNRRQVARLAARTLLGAAREPIPLPHGAPYGAVLVDTGACTLCLSCASLCPSGALLDNPDTPQLRFREDACLQCGLCATVCPEDAITLVPRFDPSDAALGQTVLNEEEPFACIECGKLFGVRSTVEKIMEKLAGKHPMFAESDSGRLIQMCDDCRVRAQYHGQANPFAAGERPRVRTTDDYLSKRRDH
ncbi:4Fe-4S binding protein [Defluviimonas sp. SAOS-178_SWC]|uniref:4Fe-4S binding protein n=1 Tax=Defluviimonas sp. SAOS-178_SWC TaxID=3121287 RepID=UPI003221C8C4